MKNMLILSFTASLILAATSSHTMELDEACLHLFATIHLTDSQGSATNREVIRCVYNDPELAIIAPYLSSIYEAKTAVAFYCAVDKARDIILSVAPYAYQSYKHLFETTWSQRKAIIQALENSGRNPYTFLP